jgi:hypothetical protein
VVSSSPFTVQVADGAGATTSKALSIDVTAPLTIVPPAFPTGTPTVSYSHTMIATGGLPPYTWAITTGTLPTGLSLDVNTGVISGTPTADGKANFTLQVSDSAKPPRTASLALSISISKPLTISTSVLPKGVVGTAYSATLQTDGGTSPFSWLITDGFGTLPTGLSLDPVQASSAERR